MPTTYQALLLPRVGGPDVLQTVDLPLTEPAPGQIRVRIRAAGVGATDLTMLAGQYIYAPKMPFVPGYEIAGVVDAVGAGVSQFQVGDRVAALTLYGGYAQYMVREAEHFLPIPPGVSDVDAAACILNYVTAWQMMYRSVQVRAGQTALVTGAAGGVGTALLQLLQLAGVKTYGAASPGKHDTLRSLGCTPLDYRAAPLAKQLRALEPAGVDYCFDAVGGANIGPCIAATRWGGNVVGYGFMGVSGTLDILRMFGNLLVGSRLRGRKGAFYGITYWYRKDPTRFRQDLPKVLDLLAQGQIKPLVAQTFDLLQARAALKLLATGKVQGKIVLTVA